MNRLSCKSDASFRTIWEIGLLLLVLSGIALSAKPGKRIAKAPRTERGVFTDSRDGQSYRWVRIGQQVWMAQNLNHALGVSWCQGDSVANCLALGRLYDWASARQACPSGWHLPTDREWTVLAKSAGVEGPGARLKSASGWNGTDDYGFDALPGGRRRFQGFFEQDGGAAFFWSASELGAESAFARNIVSGDGMLTLCSIYKREGFSVRCLKDPP